MEVLQEASQLAENGKSRFGKKDYSGAAQAFCAAAGAYAALPDELMAAEMKNNQCVALLQAKQPAAALEAVEGTEAVFAGAGDLRRQGMAMANRAAALEAQKHREEAIQLYEQAAGLLQQAGETQMRAEVMRSVAAIRIRKGEGIDAVVAMQDGLSGVEKPTLKQRILKRLLRFHLW